MSVQVFAPAKINLTLEVGRPRADGMHPLQSVVVFADIGDIVTAEAGDGLSLRITGGFADQLSDGDADNLVLCAAHALARSVGVQANAKITLEKNLPVASGIGGGSSDAAAALRALNDLWGLGCGAAQLQAIARELGSDVPVCLAGMPAWMTGLGEVWTPMRAPAFAAVLVNPMRELSTPLVYREFDRQGLGGDLSRFETPQWRDRTHALSDIVATDNALTAAASALVPDIAVIIEILRNDARVEHAAMSGSGATCFALVDDLPAAEALATDLRAAHPDWWIIETELGGA
ncbi:MAG: 4-(cytidine 5'-diphospho)-2-C-methyl-D-erythritol kinase [Proteobacteria bacterium]|nr:4-(cytidine 5'-diphospho)-2-C-methyl-D-erythritol kinase [Pseudomonadota bacterium]